MKNIPVSRAYTAVIIGIAPYQRDGAQQVDKDGQEVMTATVISTPTANEKAEVTEVRVPRSGVPKVLPTYSPVRFEELVGRAWTFEGRSGVSFRAKALVLAKAAEAPA